MTDCPGNPVVDLGQKDLALRLPTGRSFARVTVASVAKKLLSVVHLHHATRRSNWKHG